MAGPANGRRRFELYAARQLLRGCVPLGAGAAALGQASALQLELFPAAVDEAGPPHAPAIVPRSELIYYWSIDESEWASDVMFRSPEGLWRELYPRLLSPRLDRFLSSPHVLRFLGRKLPAHGGRPRGVSQGEVTSDLKQRPGRDAHQAPAESLTPIKMYDKQGSCAARGDDDQRRPRHEGLSPCRGGFPSSANMAADGGKGVADVAR